MMKFLTLLATTTTLAAPAMAQDWSAEVFGGVRDSNTLDFDGLSFDTDSGTFYGARILRNNLVKDFAFGLEVNASSADYTGFPTSSNSTAVMAIARYTLPIESPVDFYTTVGLGYIDVEFEDPNSTAGSDSDGQFGGQISLGANYEFSPGIGAFIEVTYQDAFDDSSLFGSSSVFLPVSNVEYNSTNVVIGLSYDF